MQCSWSYLEFRQGSAATLASCCGETVALVQACKVLGPVLRNGRSAQAHKPVEEVDGPVCLPRSCSRKKSTYPSKSVYKSKKVPHLCRTFWEGALLAELGAEDLPQHCSLRPLRPALKCQGRLAASARWCSRCQEK